MKITVIISTYNQPAWLEKVLWGYARQTYRDFEVIVADDGSGPETRSLIDRMRPGFPVALKHVWHEAPDYQRQKILNVALREAQGPYVVMTDGDCIPREDFLAVHARLARAGQFVSGGYCKLPMPLSQAIEAADIESQRAFRCCWLWRRGLRRFSAMLKLAGRGPWGRLFDAITPTRPTWNNCNSAGWLSDLRRINGFDERMQYGGADRELGSRLENLGITGHQARHRAVVLHLDHARGYAKADSIARNRAIRAATESERRVWTPHGIEKREQP